MKLTSKIAKKLESPLTKIYLWEVMHRFQMVKCHRGTLLTSALENVHRKKNRFNKLTPKLVIEIQIE